MKRLVTSLDERGRSVFGSVGEPPCTFHHRHSPGFTTSLVWTTEPAPVVPAGRADPTAGLTAHVPRPGGTALIYITLPPDEIMRRADIDLKKAMEEHAAINPDVASRMDPENPGMHATDSVDYVILLSGEVWAEVDDGVEYKLNPGDVVVQNGTRHRWRNKSATPATMACVIIGARRI